MPQKKKKILANTFDSNQPYIRETLKYNKRDYIKGKFQNI